MNSRSLSTICPSLILLLKTVTLESILCMSRRSSNCATTLNFHRIATFTATNSKSSTVLRTTLPMTPPSTLPYRRVRRIRSAATQFKCCLCTRPLYDSSLTIPEPGFSTAISTGTSLPCVCLFYRGSLLKARRLIGPSVLPLFEPWTFPILGILSPDRTRVKYRVWRRCSSRLRRYWRMHPYRNT